MTVPCLVKASCRWYLPVVNVVRSSPAIVLRGRSYGESDRIVTFLTQDFGKLTGIAKGAKNSRRRFVNSLDPLARVRVRFRLRPHATLAFLESAELLCPAVGLIEPVKFAYASYLVELADQLTAEEHPVRDLYVLLEQGLAELERGPATGAFLRGFEMQLLAHAGYEPQLEHCHRCQHTLDGARPAMLNPAHGTIACSDCRAPGEPAMEIPAAVLPHLSALKTLPLADCRHRLLGEAAAAAEITGRLLALHLPRPLQSVKLIRQLTA